MNNVLLKYAGFVRGVARSGAKSVGAAKPPKAINVNWNSKELNKLAPPKVVGVQVGKGGPSQLNTKNLTDQWATAPGITHQEFVRRLQALYKLMGK